MIAHEGEPIDSLALELLCPNCGYDLRGTSTHVCPECGLAIDPSALQESGFPWVHRQKIGRLRGYGRTVWWVTINSRKLSMETAKPQPWAAARGFERVTIALMTIFALCGLAALLGSAGGLAGIALKHADNPYLFSNPSRSWPILDLTLPWSAGVTFKVVLPICTIIFVNVALRVHAFLYNSRLITDSQRQRGLAIACYAISPIILLWPTALLLAVALIYNECLETWNLPFPPLGQWVVFGVPAVLATAVLLITIARTLQWWRRITRPSGGATTLALLRWFATFGWTAFVWIGLVPWCVGMLWVMFDSVFR